MASLIDIKIPDIGDFHDVDVVEVMVKPGDHVGMDDSLITIESDKATMEIPSPQAGIVKAVRVKLGDKVSEGSAIIQLEAEPDGASAADSQAGAQGADNQDGAVKAVEAKPKEVSARPREAQGGQANATAANGAGRAAPRERPALTIVAGRSEAQAPAAS
jgi:pyruvate/2-oxoglutarate dehydrogenase complex dihydrolipoamide acyltransferase (E2) component